MNGISPEMNTLKTQIIAHLKSNRIQDAKSLLETACGAEQTDADLWQMYAHVHYLKGNYVSMERCCREAVKHRPNDVNGLFNLGCALVANNNARDAENHFRLVIKMNPRHSIAHDNLGQLYEQKGFFDDARKCYENAIHGDNPRSIHYRHLGLAYLKAKNPTAAEKYFLQGMAMDDTDAKSHVELGRAQCELGKISEATESFNRALHINPELNYARFWLSAINDQATTDTAKHRFVSRLFDGHAEDFDKILVDDLGYRIPWLVADELRSAIRTDTALDILDIGCGTGLCAESLRSITNTIVGIDLSRNMLAKAEKRGAYKELLHGDIVEVMNKLDDKYDLVVAADVFIYVGNLSKAFQSCNSTLREAGLFAFSVELSDHQDGYMLRATGRYAHSVNYINSLATDNNFDILTEKNVLLRMDAGSEIRGMMYILRKE